MSGGLHDLEKGLVDLVAANRKRLAGTTSSPHHLSIVSAHLSWTDPGKSHLHAGDIGVELDSHGVGVEDVKGTVGRFEVGAGGAAFGPWSCGFERTASNARVRVMFDPPVPDGPSAWVLWTRDLPTQLNVKIPRSSLANLGIIPADLGTIANDTTDLEVSLGAVLSDSERSEFTLDAALWGARVQGFSGPTDVHIEGAGSALPGKAFDLERTSVTVGPLVAHLTGTVMVHDADLRLDAAFKTVPIACERFVSAEAKRMGTWAATLEAFGQATRALRVTGTVNASGTVKYDTKTPKEAQVAWLAKETCGVSIFGM
jgi:hypothetical protein